MTAMLEVDDLSVSFGGVHALRHVSFKAEVGAIVGLIGPNGAGKSTLLNCISGITTPSGGAIRLDGQALRRITPDALAARGVGRVFQHPDLVGELSVLDNLLIARHRSLRYGLFAEWLGLPRVAAGEREAERMVRGVAARLGLEPLLLAAALSLPYGHRKLVELGRAMVMQSRLFLLDEPIAGLNESEIEKLESIVRALREQPGVAVVLVEHNMGLVKRLCDHVVVLDAGQVIARGSADEVLSDPKVLLAYLGEETADAP
ncbi:ABC transporter ATP-binding protein [Variovorax paradoxus]|jgi:branched-chain amino acid transport system ATP-binding protein|uniref:ABC transporter ATP-binding protein n=1 Tax=Variovorax paradoxus TaxID=34073 RepID=UPI0006E6913B|nr:ABC transporter ATP-binding protein [Variovorax paradoxus]KPV03402.1 ABC transporter ATP-binding protein [Variovorax paradoxus]KPV04685.1 ABC transporter ATP-binding protein [Variovorax paradoxus]KPV19195.1 ABC transporter ATP-binding protein [Variovorax paradoxus]KPV30207.1 ABC transporter ATP-binding protein [Variovorax paradoxus]